jgi:hypothetical protein
VRRPRPYGFEYSATTDTTPFSLSIEAVGVTFGKAISHQGSNDGINLRYLPTISSDWLRAEGRSAGHNANKLCLAEIPSVATSTCGVLLNCFSVRANRNGIRRTARLPPNQPRRTLLLTNPNRRSFVAGAAASVLSLSAKASIFHWHIHHKRRLSNPHASRRARKLYDYLWSIYGHKTLTGQQVSAWSGPRSELDYLQRTTGKQPAILGLDYINPQRWPFVAERATRWYLEEGGIPTICLALGRPRHRHRLRERQEGLRSAVGAPIRHSAERGPQSGPGRRYRSTRHTARS